MIDSMSRVGLTVGFSPEKPQVLDSITLNRKTASSCRDDHSSFSPSHKYNLTSLISLGFFCFSYINSHFPQMRLNAFRGFHIPRGLVGKRSDIIVTQKQALALLQESISLQNKIKQYQKLINQMDQNENA